MGFFDLAEILGTYGQYLVLLLGIGVSPFPDWIQQPMLVLRFLNIDTSSSISALDPFTSDAVRTIVPPSLPLDLRLQYLLITVIAPVFFASVCVFIVSPKLFVLWFFFAVLSCYLCTGGAVPEVLPEGAADIGVAAHDDYHRYVFISGLIIGLFVVAGAIWWLVVYAIRQKSDGTFLLRLHSRIPPTVTLHAICRKETKHFDWPGQIIRLCYILLCIVAGLGCLDVIPLRFLTFLNKLGAVSYFFAAFFFLLASFGILWGVICCFEGGREVLWMRAAKHISLLLSILLLLTTFLVVPVTSNVVAVLTCVPGQNGDNVTCPAGHRLPDPSESLVPYSAFTWYSYSTTRNFTAIYSGAGAAERKAFCQPMDIIFTDPSYNRTRCPAWAAAPEITRSPRLYSDRSVLCSKSFRTYFSSSAAIAILTLALLVVLQVHLTSTAVHALEERYPLDACTAIGLEDEQVLAEKLAKSNTVAKVIYAGLQRKYRHWRSFPGLLHRFAVIVVSKAYFGGADDTEAQTTSVIVAMSLNLVLHLIMTAMLSFLRPYNRRVENVLAIATSVAVTVVALIGLIGAAEPSTVAAHPGLYIFMAVIVVLAPVVALAIGLFLTNQDESANAQERGRRIQAAIDKAQEAAASNVSQAPQLCCLTGVDEKVIRAEAAYEGGVPLTKKVAKFFQGGGGGSSGGGGLKSKQQQRSQSVFGPVVNSGEPSSVGSAVPPDTDDDNDDDGGGREFRGGGSEGNALDNEFSFDDDASKGGSSNSSFFFTSSSSDDDERGGMLMRDNSSDIANTFTFSGSGGLTAPGTAGENQQKKEEKEEEGSKKPQVSISLTQPAEASPAPTSSKRRRRSRQSVAMTTFLLDNNMNRSSSSSSSDDDDDDGFLSTGKLPPLRVVGRSRPRYSGETRDDDDDDDNGDGDGGAEAAGGKARKRTGSRVVYSDALPDDDWSRGGYAGRRRRSSGFDVGDGKRERRRESSSVFAPDGDVDNNSSCHRRRRHQEEVGSGSFSLEASASGRGSILGSPTLRRMTTTKALRRAISFAGGRFTESDVAAATVAQSPLPKSKPLSFSAAAAAKEIIEQREKKDHQHEEQQQNQIGEKEDNKPVIGGLRHALSFQAKIHLNRHDVPSTFEKSSARPGLEHDLSVSGLQQTPSMSLAAGAAAVEKSNPSLVKSEVPAAAAASAAASSAARAGVIHRRTSRFDHTMPFATAFLKQQEKQNQQQQHQKRREEEEEEEEEEGEKDKEGDSSINIDVVNFAPFGCAPFAAALVDSQKMQNTRTRRAPFNFGVIVRTKARPMEFVPPAKRAIWNRRAETASRLLRYRTQQQQKQPKMAEIVDTACVALPGDARNSSSSSPLNLSSPLSIDSPSSRGAGMEEKPTLSVGRNLWLFAINSVIDNILLASLEVFLSEEADVEDQVARRRREILQKQRERRRKKQQQQAAVNPLSREAAKENDNDDDDNQHHHDELFSSPPKAQQKISATKAGRSHHGGALDEDQFVHDANSPKAAPTDPESLSSQESEVNRSRSSSAGVHNDNSNMSNDQSHLGAMLPGVRAVTSDINGPPAAASDDATGGAMALFENVAAVESPAVNSTVGKPSFALSDIAAPATPAAAIPVGSSHSVSAAAAAAAVAATSANSDVKPTPPSSSSPSIVGAHHTSDLADSVRHAAAGGLTLAVHEASDGDIEFRPLEHHPSVVLTPFSLLNNNSQGISQDRLDVVAPPSSAGTSGALPPPVSPGGQTAEPGTVSSFSASTAAAAAAATGASAESTAQQQQQQVTNSPLTDLDPAARRALVERQQRGWRKVIVNMLMQEQRQRFEEAEEEEEGGGGGGGGGGAALAAAAGSDVMLGAAAGSLLLEQEPSSVFGKSFSSGLAGEASGGSMINEEQEGASSLSIKTDDANKEIARDSNKLQHDEDEDDDVDVDNKASAVLPPSMRRTATTRELIDIQRALAEPMMQSEKQAQRLKRRIRKMYERHLVSVRLRQEATDFRINRDAQLHLQIYFTVMALALLVALYLGLIGAVQTQREELGFFLPPNGVDVGILRQQYVGKNLTHAEMQLAGYTSWASFVKSCCCTAFDNQTDSLALSVEKWICENGKVKERARRISTDGGVNALNSVRGLCETDFKNGCELHVTEGPPHWVTLKNCNETVVTKAEQEFW